MMQRFLLFAGVVILSGMPALSAAPQVQKMIFEEQRIEGKIRRPQLVLIKAEQRPQFQPMVIQAVGKTTNVVGSVSSEIIDDSPYKKPFRFNGTRISNIVP